MSPTHKAASAALVQRFIAHYRFPLFDKLHKTSRYNWKFLSDRHPGGASSGLEPADYGDLPVTRIHQRRLYGPLDWQAGVIRGVAGADAVVLDLGWTILSNPWVLIRTASMGMGRIGWSKGIGQKDGTRKHRARLMMERWIARQCDALIVYGRMSRRYFVETLRIPADRVFVAQNTTDTSRIIRERDLAVTQARELQARLRLPNRPVVGFLGKIAAFKQPLRIVEAFEQVRAMGVDATLVLAGKGPQRAELEARIQASPVRADIRYEPDVPAGMEGGWFQLFDLYATFSQAGLGVLESMAHQRAVLSTPEEYPETELLADGDTAFLSAEFTVDSFARRMADALRSPQERVTIARRAETRVAAEATQEKMVESIDAAVTWALARASGVLIPVSRSVSA